jgi:hypothetical protein
VKVTADTITDGQIRHLADAASVAADYDFGNVCADALGLDRPRSADQLTPSLKAAAREKCAAIWNARNAEVSP